MSKPAFVSDYDEVVDWIDRRAAEQTARTKAVLMEAGRPDLVEELERNLKNVRTGVTGARAAWAALSQAQKRVLSIVANGRHLVREHGSKSFYEAHGEPHALSRVCRLPTARNLIARELLDCDGGALDPERRLVISERGQFVYRQAVKDGTASQNP